MKRVKRLVWQVARFGMVGISCFLVDYFLMIILTEFTSLGYFLASGISFIISTILNYLLSMRFVFSGKEDANHFFELGIFLLLSLVGLGLNQMIMWIEVEKLKIPYMLAKIGSAVIVSVYSFISRKIIME